MNEQHIIEVLEGSALTGLSEDELNLIRTHASVCPPCQEAFVAAQLATLLVKERAAETIEPSPFFQTRVLAALRERQMSNSPLRMWKAAKALVAAMAATVAALAVLTFMVPAETSEFQQVAANSYSAEEIILDSESSAMEQMSYEQVLSTLYSADDNDSK